MTFFFLRYAPLPSRHLDLVDMPALAPRGVELGPTYFLAAHGEPVESPADPGPSVARALRVNEESSLALLAVRVGSSVLESAQIEMSHGVTRSCRCHPMYPGGMCPRCARWWSSACRRSTQLATSRSGRGGDLATLFEP